MVLPNELRQQAYEDLMHKHNQKPITYSVSFDVSDAEKERVFRKMFTEHPEVDGIFADNDTNASLMMFGRKSRDFSHGMDRPL